jgi:hypothetical protein
MITVSAPGPAVATGRLWLAKSAVGVMVSRWTVAAGAAGGKGEKGGGRPCRLAAGGPLSGAGLPPGCVRARPPVAGHRRPRSPPAIAPACRKRDNTCPSKIIPAGHDDHWLQPVHRWAGHPAPAHRDPRPPSSPRQDRHSHGYLQGWSSSDPASRPTARMTSLPTARAVTPLRFTTTGTAYPSARLASPPAIARTTRASGRCQNLPSPGPRWPSACSGGWWLVRGWEPATGWRGCRDHPPWRRLRRPR